jgi:hypothetical protein
MISSQIFPTPNIDPSSIAIDVSSLRDLQLKNHSNLDSGL